MESKKKIKLKDVAEKMGISIVSVSNALNGRAGVSAALRKQIQETAVAMGYQMETIKEKEKEQKKMVGILYSEEERMHAKLYFKTDLKFLEKEFAKIGYQVCVQSMASEKNAGQTSIFEGKKLQGILIAGKIEDEIIRKKLNESGIPLLFLYTGEYGRTNNYIAPDYFRGAQMCVQKMIYYGHRRIWLLKDNRTEKGIATDIYLGYEKALDVNGITEKREMDLAEVARRLEEKKPFPTAFLCEDISVAKKLEQLLQEKNDVPNEKIAIMSLGILQNSTNERYSGMYYMQKDILSLCKEALEKKYYNKENGGRVLIVQGKFHAGSTLYKA